MDPADEKMKVFFIPVIANPDTSHDAFMFKSIVRHLKVMINEKLTSKGHLDYGQEAAVKASASPARMKSNIRGPKYSR